MAKGWIPNAQFKRRLGQAIDALPKAGRIGARRALAKNGQEAEEIIRADAPEADGDLKASVGWTFGDPPPGVLGGRDARRDSAIPDDLRISIYAGGKRAPHAHLVHNGTGPRQTRDGKSTGISPPRPFFWPNIRSLRRRQNARISREMLREMKKGR